MRAGTSLRIASVLTLIHAALHTVGGVFGKQATGAQQAVADVMRSTTFPMAGLTRSYWDLYFGMALAVSVFLTLEGVVLWQLGSIAKRDAQLVRPVVMTFLVGYLGLAVVSYRYFFAAPAITEILIAVFLAMALRQDRN